MQGLLDTPAEFNRRIAKADRARVLVQKDNIIFRMVSDLAQLAEYKRLTADRLLEGQSLPSIERARKQLERDEQYIQGLIEACGMLREILSETVSRFEVAIAKGSGGGHRMKVIGAILADFESGPLGTSSRLADPLGNETVLRRTVIRVTQVAGLASIHVLVPTHQKAQAQQLLQGLPAIVQGADWPPAPHRDLVATTRKWALHNWRGGIGGACAIDETFHAAGLRALATMVQADGVMVVPAHAAMLSVDLSRQMLAHFQEHGRLYRMTFAQSPPGLTPLFVSAALLADLEQAGYPPGAILAYNPASPEPDPIGKPICYQVPTPVACTAGRLLADTGESFALCRSAIEALGEQLAADPVALCQFVAKHAATHVPPLPAELEVELTTQDALPATPLRRAAPQSLPGDHSTGRSWRR